MVHASFELLLIHSHCLAWTLRLTPPFLSSFRALTTIRQLHERCGVPEYWIVFPDENQVLQLVLVDGAYSKRIGTDTVTMFMPPQVKVDLTEVW